MLLFIYIIKFTHVFHKKRIFEKGVLFFVIAVVINGEGISQTKTISSLLLLTPIEDATFIVAY